jgi:hypothetical protein
MFQIDKSELKRLLLERHFNGNSKTEWLNHTPQSFRDAQVENIVNLFPNEIPDSLQPAYLAWFNNQEVDTLIEIDGVTIKDVMEQSLCGTLQAIKLLSELSIKKGKEKEDYKKMILQPPFFL